MKLSLVKTSDFVFRTKLFRVYDMELPFVDHLAREFKLDYLDRSFLDGKGDTSEKLPRLVRYIGKQISKRLNAKFSFVFTRSLLTNKSYRCRFC